MAKKDLPDIVDQGEIEKSVKKQTKAEKENIRAFAKALRKADPSDWWGNTVYDIVYEINCNNACSYELAIWNAAIKYENNKRDKINKMVDMDG